MKLSHSYTTRRARIEMIPLIDIVFLLLVFFIYAMLSMAVHRGIKVDLPAATTGEVDDRDHINITIDGRNQIYLNKEPVGLADLPGQIRAKRQDKDDMPVFISGDRTADLGLGIEILDLLRKNGVERVSFQTKRKREAKPSSDETE